jgi:hypothetical protein
MVKIRDVSGLTDKELAQVIANNLKEILTLEARWPLEDSNSKRRITAQIKQHKSAVAQLSLKLSQRNKLVDF